MMECGDGPERGRGGDEVGRAALQEGDHQAQGAAMGDDDAGGAGAQVGADGLDAADQVGAGLAAGRGEQDGVGGPGVDLAALDIVPAPAFPGAEIEFLQAGVDACVRGQGVGEGAAAAGRAGQDPVDAGGAQGRGQGREAVLAGAAEADVEAAVAAAGLDVGFGMADEEDGHSAGYSAPPAFGPAFRAELRRLFEWRRDVRRFRSQPVEAALLDDLLAAAWLAPSVGLSEPWRFVTVDDPARRAAIIANFTACNRAALESQTGGRAELYARLKLEGLGQAPRHIAVFVDEAPLQGHGLGRQTMPETVGYSAAMAIHTLWLAARAAGLGLGWVSILDPAAAHAALDVDPAWRLIAYLCLGYPEEESITPALERSGWERRAASARGMLQR